MLANNASKILPVAKAVVQTRAMSIVSGPPRVHVSSGVSPFNFYFWFSEIINLKIIYFGVHCSMEL